MATTAALSHPETVPRDEALRAELLQMAEQDQAAPSATSRGGMQDQGAADRMVAIDRRNTARMREIVARHGWPNTELVGKDGAQAAWLLVQHADDLAFQRRCLTLMEQAASRGGVDPQNLAYLVDRVRMREGRPQLYGTQLREQEEQLVPFPIEDEEHVDDRRESVGMPPLAEYVRHAARLYGPREEERAE